jgi:ABC-type molybdate transport system substrate-binding protein
VRSAGFLGGLLCLSVAFWTGPTLAADPVRIYAAGSLGVVLPELIAASGLPEGSVAAPVFGPAGVLGKRLLSGETADLFASADLAQPQAVAAAKGALVVPFARNRMCLATPGKLGLTAATMLDRMLSPDFRLAASTPGADPGGDYARAVFARANALRPGAEAALIAKTLLLLGGPGSMTPQPGHTPAATIFLGDHADALLYYCSGTAAAAREVPGLVSIPVPDALEVGPVYGLAIMSDRPEAARLALFMLSDRGQAILAHGGLLPVLAAR